MDTLFLIGRIILGGFFIYSGLNHFLGFGMMANYTKMKGIPLPQLAVAITGLMLILGGLSMVLGAYPKIGIALLAGFLIPVSLLMHNFWKIQDPQLKVADKVNFTKNMALLGAVLMFLAIPSPWPLSVMLW